MPIINGGVLSLRVHNVGDPDGTINTIEELISLDGREFDIIEARENTAWPRLRATWYREQVLARLVKGGDIVVGYGD